MPPKKTSAPEASAKELVLLKKLWTISDDSKIIFFADEEDAKGQALSMVTHVEVVVRKVKGKDMELVNWFTANKKKYTVDWMKNNFGRTVTAPRLNQFIGSKKPSAKIGLFLFSHPASTMKQGVRSARPFFKSQTPPSSFIVEDTLFYSLFDTLFRHGGNDAEYLR